MNVYLVTHVHEVSEEIEDMKFIGVYSTKTQAEEAVARARILPGFCNVPEGFHVQEYPLGKDHWTEGFFTWTPDSIN